MHTQQAIRLVPFGLRSVLFLALVLIARVPVGAITCTVPGSGTAILEGWLQVEGSAALVTLTDLQVRNGCQPAALSVADGAQVEGTGLVVVRSAVLPCPVITRIFSDGFESGDSQAWSSTVQ